MRDDKEKKKMKLTEYVRNYIPVGWKEPIGSVYFIHRFSAVEYEAIEQYFKEQGNKEITNGKDD